MFALPHNKRLIRSILLMIFFSICLFGYAGTYVHAQDASSLSDATKQALAHDISADINGTATSGQEKKLNEGGGTAWWDVGGHIMDAIAGVMYTVSSGIGAFFVGIGGVLLDLSVQVTILDFGNLVGPGGDLGQAIIAMWQVLRDIINMFFIFGLIYIGIKTILSADDSSTRRTLGLLIIAALMINFSLYITEVVIDFTNIAAVQMYNQITSGGDETGDLSLSAFSTNTQNLMGVGHNTITGRFMDVTGITSLFGDIPKIGSGGISSGTIMIYSILLFFFCIVAAIIFAMGAFLLISRAIALIIYMILSPAMFIGFILPSMQKQQDAWRNGFFKQALFAPAFLFMIYLSLYVVEKLKDMLGFNGHPSEFIQATSGQTTPGFLTLTFLFFMAMGFLYASIRVGQMMSLVGSKATLSLTQKAIGGATAGLAARTGRMTAGRFGNFISTREGLKEAASRSGFVGNLARGTLKSSRVVGDASFDARQIGGVGKSLGIGTGKKGGYKTRTEEIEKKEKAFAKSLGEVGDDDSRVNSLSAQKNAAEATLAAAKIERDVANAKRDEAAIRTTGEAVANAEKTLKQLEEDLKREKNRRQIGSAADRQAFNETSTKVKESDNKIKDYRKEFITTQKRIQEILKEEATEANKQALEAAKKEAEEINKKMIAEQNELKKLRKEEKKQLGTLGYAGVLEKANFLSSAPFGRIVNQNRKAGDEIRKQYEKTIKKSKEDERFDGLKESVEKSAKKD